MARTSRKVAARSARLRPAWIHNAGADVIARLADFATNDDRWPLFGAPGAT
jgi:hypothetical protein